MVMRTRLRTHDPTMALTGAHGACVCHDVICRASFIRPTPAPHCASPSIPTLAALSIMADSWRDGILLKVVISHVSMNFFSQSHRFLGLEHNRLYPVPRFKHIHVRRSRWRLLPRQTDLYHACPMGISYLVCTSAFVERWHANCDPGH